uniref:GOLD domain-containing protein n=1 Tax=Tetraselmis chuii TaxID=63592 RepID=A0A7S1SV81_9CHLO|mmetsp:Transcript_3095/g.5639  ORF Transcript_3095/g.5639 Transcript_3095/m.5639 type:complete len:208 (+) Transcript_3095:192-815(+)|eukprot:CAMPEP_0177776928 /NCGR_PEP_ID=MMETSP0491_2-20121128/14994_1 /TAXON_ID=63592 /ORGANISM="Tetraselmis chuii, Strain PLY429" /LENGTH=207 /DNA_ID=CAMNT_0019295791 /DNA_START=166 /DNA_END=789 /DNA_ORIENTATION=+
MAPFARPLALLLLHIAATAAMEFDMTYQTKCVMEEIGVGVLVLGEYSAFLKDEPEHPPVEVDVKVEDPNGVVLYEHMAVKEGTFAFTSKTAGDYKTCFTAKDIPTAEKVKIQLEWKTGVAAKDWDTIAKKSNLNAMATELHKLEEMVKEIHGEMMAMRDREEDMRNLNETTNSRVASFSIVSLMVCIGVGVWQLLYLKSFFVRKKLL